MSCRTRSPGLVIFIAISLEKRLLAEVRQFKITKQTISQEKKMVAGGPTMNCA